MSVWLITGSSRGLGRQYVTAALAAGHSVVAGVRNLATTDRALAEHERVLPVELDVTRPEQITAAVETALATFGRIDVLVNNAGYGLLGALEETELDEARDLFEVNVFGAVAMIRAVLPVMRAQRSGRILNAGSMGGIMASPGSSMYAATKFAIEAITESLAAELRGTGVSATVIELGAFRTGFHEADSIRRTAAPPIPAYAATVGVALEGLGSLNGTQPGDPRKAGEALVAIAEAHDPPLRVQLGFDAIARLETKMAILARDLERWRVMGESTDFD